MSQLKIVFVNFPYDIIATIIFIKNAHNLGRLKSQLQDEYAMGL